LNRPLDGKYDVINEKRVLNIIILESAKRIVGKSEYPARSTTL